MADEITYGSHKTTIEIKDGDSNPVAGITSWKEQIAQAVVDMIKELKAEGLPITDIPGVNSITVTMEKTNE
jgi:precorrin-4 methylase